MPQAPELRGLLGASSAEEQGLGEAWVPLGEVLPGQAGLPGGASHGRPPIPSVSPELGRLAWLAQDSLVLCASLSSVTPKWDGDVVVVTQPTCGPLEAPRILSLSMLVWLPRPPDTGPALPAALPCW